MKKILSPSIVLSAVCLMSLSQIVSAESPDPVGLSMILDTEIVDHITAIPKTTTHIQNGMTITTVTVDDMKVVGVVDMIGSGHYFSVDTESDRSQKYTKINPNTGKGIKDASHNLTTVTIQDGQMIGDASSMDAVISAYTVENPELQYLSTPEPILGSTCTCEVGSVSQGKPICGADVLDSEKRYKCEVRPKSEQVMVGPVLEKPKSLTRTIVGWSMYVMIFSLIALFVHTAVMFSRDMRKADLPMAGYQKRKMIAIALVVGVLLLIQYGISFIVH